METDESLVSDKSPAGCQVLPYMPEGADGPRTDSEAPGEPSVAWPSIAICEGRLFALGPPEGISGLLLAHSHLRGVQAIAAKEMRPVSACPATSEFDRRWLERMEREWPDRRLVWVANQLMLAPRPAE